MSEADQLITIKILDRIYKIKCPSEQASDLQQAAVYLDEQMRKLQSTKQASSDRLAIVAALNVSNELLALKKQKSGYIDLLGDRIQKLHERVKTAVAETA